jgi:hypothetical protein
MRYHRGMSTDANLVLATPDEMRAACPGYREALAEPVPLTVINPITKQPQEIASWDPEPGAPFPAEAAGAPNLDGLKHAYKDGLDGDHLRSLATALEDADPSRSVVPFLIVPHGLDTLGVEIIALAFTARLDALTDDEAAAATVTWAEAIHIDEATCERWIKALRAFATQARAEGRRIFAIITES